MSRRIALSVVTAGMFLVGVASAHDPSKHKGKPVNGEVTSVAARQFQLKTTTGTVTVSLTDQTRFERGKEALDRAHLKSGEMVSVIGTKLGTGELVAKEVLWAVPGPRADQKKSGGGVKPAGEHKR